MQSLLLFTLGPVQSFISAARKTQDLYAGSYLLSYLSRTAIDKAKYLGGEIVFPCSREEQNNNSKDNSVPNKFLAIYNNSEKDKLMQIGQDIEQAVRDEFLNMGKVILQNLGVPEPRYYEKQLKNHLEFYWFFKPFEITEYAKVYKSLSTIMGTVKNVRKFEQMAELPGLKCSIDGEHNALFWRIGNKPKNIIKGAVSVPNKYIDKKERLGALAFVKRCADQYFQDNYIRNFPSTARIALLDAFDQLPQEKKGLIEPGLFNEELIFELYNNKEFCKSIKNNIIEDEELKRAQEVYKLFKKNKIQFSPYYAVLLFDGDSMGKLYANPNLKKGSSLLEFHKTLSNSLINFAGELKNEVLVGNKGIVVYAGGEDFLGLVNLRNLFNIMSELRVRFGNIDLSKYTEQKLTFSAGVAIAHYRTPLAEALKWAHKMIDEAKDHSVNGEKDAFSIAVLKHSGEINKTVFKWEIDEFWTTDIFQEVIENLGTNFSSNFIKNLNLELSRLIDKDDKGNITINRVFQVELPRLLYKSLIISKQKSESLKDFDERKAKAISNLQKKITSLYFRSNNKKNFLDALNIMAFMERMGEMFTWQ